MDPDYQQGVGEAGAGIEMLWDENYGNSQGLIKNLVSFLHRCDTHKSFWILLALRLAMVAGGGGFFPERKHNHHNSAQVTLNWFHKRYAVFHQSGACQLQRPLRKYRKCWRPSLNYVRPHTTNTTHYYVIMGSTGSFQNRYTHAMTSSPGRFYIS